MQICSLCTCCFTAKLVLIRKSAVHAPAVLLPSWSLYLDLQCMHLLSYCQVGLYTQICIVCTCCLTAKLVFLYKSAVYAPVFLLLSWSLYVNLQFMHLLFFCQVGLYTQICSVYMHLLSYCQVGFYTQICSICTCCLTTRSVFIPKSAVYAPVVLLPSWSLYGNLQCITNWSIMEKFFNFETMLLLKKDAMDVVLISRKVRYEVYSKNYNLVTQCATEQQPCIQEKPDYTNVEF